MIHGTAPGEGLSLRISVSLMGILLILAFFLASRFWGLKPETLLRINTETGKYLLKSSIPFLAQTAEEDDPLTIFHTNWADLYWRFAANVKRINPLGILETQFPLVALYQPVPEPIQRPPLARAPDLPEAPPQLPQTEPNNDTAPDMQGDPAVFIYHTHTTESYIPNSGKDHLVDQKGDVVKVGSYLKQVLEQKYHIKTEQSETIHDLYPFRDSYKRSNVTVVNYLKQHPATKVVIDLHRDATPGLPNKCDINGEKCATIAMIVGTDKMGLPHPHWKKNLTFVQELTDAMKLYYPGLSNGIIMSDARYNQHLHTHAILVEFGDQDTALEEAYRAADRFAEILNMVLGKDTSAETTLGGEP